ncbi:MAG: nuclear transport factor 2 family protein [Caulobacteraceae bacterium]|nr:nuclear transport factor 2 family protein [Caulobacteraceae bacterium]
MAASVSQAATHANAGQAGDKRLIVEGERAWARAYVTGDVATVGRLLDERFVGVDPQGATYDKAAVAREVRNGPRATSDEVGAVSVRFYGDTAIAQAHEHEVGPAPERKASEHVFTDTWRRIGGQWRIVAAEDVDVTTGVSVTPGSAYAEDKTAILALRAQNNRAIAAHDPEGVMAMAADDYVTVGGAGDIQRGLAGNLKLWAEEFARPGFDRYVRSPTDLQVGERKDVLRAAESGTWEGVNRLPAGEARPFGRYFAHWSKQSGRWLVVSETYVTLGCRGAGC